MLTPASRLGRTLDGYHRPRTHGLARRQPPSGCPPHADARRSTILSVVTRTLRLEDPSCPSRLGDRRAVDALGGRGTPGRVHRRRPRRQPWRSSLPMSDQGLADFPATVGCLPPCCAAGCGRITWQHARSDTCSRLKSSAQTRGGSSHHRPRAARSASAASEAETQGERRPS